jgi:hypothetical protein
MIFDFTEYPDVISGLKQDGCGRNNWLLKVYWFPMLE